MTIEPEAELLKSAPLVHDILWHKGSLKHLLHDGQRLIYDRIANQKEKLFYCNISRRWGKSTLLLVVAFEKCLQKKHALVLYVAPFAKDAENISQDIARMLLQNCPEDLRPEYNAQSKEFRFPNGSRIRFIGANNERARFARGIGIDLGIIDEAAEVDDLKYLLEAVMMPMTLHSRAKILLASTPPRTPGHAATVLALQCRDQGRGGYAHFTIYDNPTIAREDIESAITECRGKDTTDFRREYLADLTCVDAATAVIPEFPKVKDEVVKFWPRPPFFDTYVSMDPGMADATGMVFGYWDFRAAKLIIEDEWLQRRAGTAQIAKAINEIESRLWPGVDGEPRPVYMRISDHDLRLIADLHTEHGLVFGTAIKADSQAGINLLRVWIHEKRIIISPKCQQLIQQLTNATYNTTGTDLDRTDLDGHYDLVAALKYLVRAIVPHRNPYPSYYDRQLPTLPEMVRAAQRNTEFKKAIMDLSTPFAKRVLRTKRRKLTRF